MHIRTLIVSLALGAALVSAAPAGAQSNAASSMSGVWRGVQWSDTTPRTAFQATLVITVGGGITGTIAEDNTSSHPGAFRVANVEGARSPTGTLAFTKTYFGEEATQSGRGAQARPSGIRYSGQPVDGGHRIVGEWVAEGAAPPPSGATTTTTQNVAHGHFEMAK